MTIPIFGIPFHVYGLIIGLAIIISTQVSEWYLKRSLNLSIPGRIVFFAVILGIVGARAYHVADKWTEVYSQNIWQSFYLWNGGLGIMGALIGGSAGIIIGYYLSDIRRQVRLIEVFDGVFFGLPLGQALGRFANFFNNEIVGKNGEPLFLIESIFSLIVFSVIYYSHRHRYRAGTVTGTYLVGYGTVRFLLDPLRTNEAIWFVGRWSVASMISLLMIGVGLYFIFRRRS